MPTRSALRLGALVAALALLTAACGDSASGTQGVRDDQRLLYLELPDSWHVVGDDVLASVTGTPFVVQDASLTLPVVSRVVFEAAGGTLGSEGFDVSTSPVPVGSAVVRSISSSQRDQISRYWLAELVVPYHGQQVAQELFKGDVSIADGYDGVQLIVAYNEAATSADAAVAFISVTDPAAQRMYSIAIGCSIECYGDNQAEILAIIDSWVVNTDA